MHLWAAIVGIAIILLILLDAFETIVAGGPLLNPT